MNTAEKEYSELCDQAYSNLFDYDYMECFASCAEGLSDNTSCCPVLAKELTKLADQLRVVSAICERNYLLVNKAAATYRFGCLPLKAPFLVDGEMYSKETDEEAIHLATGQWNKFPEGQGCIISESQHMGYETGKEA